MNFHEASDVLDAAMRAARDRANWASDTFEYQRDRDAWRDRLRTLSEVEGEAQRAAYGMLYALTDGARVPS